MVKIHYQQLVDELLQLCLWIELLARQEGGMTRNQRELIAGRVRRALQRVADL